MFYSIKKWQKYLVEWKKVSNFALAFEEQGQRTLEKVEKRQKIKKVT